MTAIRKMEFGRWGEGKAESSLLKKGYEIIERNYRMGRGEIDLICRDGETIVFVEVKARGGKEFGPPEAAIDKRKRQQLIKLAKRYLAKKNLWGKVDSRFDVIAVDYERGIVHIEDAFRA